MSRAKGKVVAPEADVAPEPHGYEFGGPIGAALISFGLPVGCYAFSFLCNDVSGCPAPSVLHPSTLTLEKLKQDVGWKGVSSVINVESAIATFGWYFLSLLLNVVLPAQEVEGVELSSGGRLKYRMNAFYSSIFILSICAAGTALQGPDFPVWTFIYDNFIPLLTCNILFSFGLATYVYVKSFSVKPGNRDKRELAAGGKTGNLIYDWYIGRELNPRITLPLFCEIDIKSFMEIRPGLLGWAVLDLTFLMHQYKTYGYVNASMLIVVFSQITYVLDAMYMEPAILTTIDITTDGFGFMLAFGDVAWLPFTYSMSARYLSVHPVALGIPGVAAIVAVQALGLYIFRAANNEKNRFRTNPQDPRVAHLKYLQTRTGSKLLTSGWWGTARHINYLGDWIMSWAFCLPTLFAGYQIKYPAPFPGAGRVSPTDPAGTALNGTLALSPEVVQDEAKGWGMLFTYFYLLYFAILLIHRQRRDDEKCARKYGADWEEYKRRVPARIVPGVY